MSRRCKPGMRARVIGANANRGKIVVVVRYYFGEEVSGSTWPAALFPWVVTSLGAPLACCCYATGAERPSKMTVVMDDWDLEPLRDDQPEELASEGVSTPTNALKGQPLAVEEQP